MWELCMHLDYDNLYIPLNSKKDKFQPQSNIFHGNKNLLSIEPTVERAKISLKNASIFLVWDLVTIG